MKVGTAQIDITPKPGIELAGFAVRPQPSTGVLDPLNARALYLEDGAERLLWLHVDLLALEQSFADAFRHWAETELGVPSSRVLLSASHTHSGPAAIQLIGCGEVDRAYVSWLNNQLQSAARSALRDLDPCRVVGAEGVCQLGVDRCPSVVAHTDPRVGALGWRRGDGSFKAVFLSYAMHPVCLRGSELSADWPGEAARVLSGELPGRPVALVGIGACGNVNPPAVGVAPAQMRDWGGQIAESVRSRLLAAEPERTAGESGILRVASDKVALPLDDWRPDTIKDYAKSCQADPTGHREFGDKFQRAIEAWRSTMSRRFARAEPQHAQAELTVVSLGRAILVAVNAEVFSPFTALAGAEAGCPVYTLSCANGMMGYVPTAEAYAKNGYEVAWAMLFYNMPRPRRRGLELLASQARRLITGLGTPGLAPLKRPSIRPPS
jgi:hypothetical protein